MGNLILYLASSQGLVLYIIAILYCYQIKASFFLLTCNFLPISAPLNIERFWGNASEYQDQQYSGRGILIYLFIVSACIQFSVLPPYARCNDPFCAQRNQTKGNNKSSVQMNGACALHSGPLSLAFQVLFPYCFYFQLMYYFTLVSVQRLGVFFFVLFQVCR